MVQTLVSVRLLKPMTQYCFSVDLMVDLRFSVLNLVTNSQQCDEKKKRSPVRSHKIFTRATAGIADSMASSDQKGALADFINADMIDLKEVLRAHQKRQDKAQEGEMGSFYRESTASSFSCRLGMK